VNHLSKVFTQLLPGVGFGDVDHKSNALPIALPRHLYGCQFCRCQSSQLTRPVTYYTAHNHYDSGPNTFSACILQKLGCIFC